MEVLLSSLALTFLFLSLKFAKNGTSIKNKKLWLYVFLCGFSMGLYLLNWTGAILFLFIIFAFLSIYYLIEFISGCNGNWILVAGLIIFSIPFLMIIPFLGHPNLNLSIYGINHLISFGLGFLGFLALWICALITEKKHFKPWLIIICLVIFCLLVMLCLKVILPDIFEKILVLSNGINNNGNAQINFKNFVGEMKPLKFQEAIDNFSSLFFIYILGFLIIVYNFFKRKEAKNLLLIIWTVIIFLINGIIFPFGQRRFFIYLAVGVSLFSAFIVVRGLEFGWKALGISSRLEKTSALRVYSIVGSILILFNIVFFVIYPFPFNVGLASPQSWPTIVQLAINGVKSPYIISNDWYYALQWLRANTPDPGLDFYALYEEPVVDNKTGLANDYEYPPQAYGVLSSWDFGHAIEYFGRRMVVANNFQVGIGNKLNSEVSNLGEAIFFLETDENLAASYLDQLKVKYIITDYQMALPNSGYFISHVVMTQGNLNGYLSDDRSDNVVKDKVDNSMVARLHLLDGSGVSGEKGIKDKKVKLDIQSLSHFRILYESVTIMDSFSDESLSQDIKAVKIFEYVKGAIIKGYTIPGVEVEISTNVKTNQDREFIYKQKITSKDGSFEFVVPYSTGKQEQSDVLAREYMIKIGSYERKIKVSEDDILQGKTLTIN
jgi:dolichyl-diphosphooligosaccharide--protein glycosyltransferase